MEYLTPEEILIIHARIIDEIGGLHGVRDIGLLVSLCERPRSAFAGKEFYLGIHRRAAVLMEALAQYHVFVDGN